MDGSVTHEFWKGHVMDEPVIPEIERADVMDGFVSPEVVTGVVRGQMIGLVNFLFVGIVVIKHVTHLQCH